ncbi:MAG TPA: hypothetical protein VG057_16030 [Solirubrobacteraceae bacterium]|jgi:hypothetical protein|nr:hypothetical protein [Solirubrobacteraceae bacterium]
MISWLSFLVIDQPATLMHVGGGVGVPVGSGVGLGVGLVEGLALGVGSADAVGEVDGVGAGDTVVVGVGVGPEPVAELLHALTSTTAAIAMLNRR